MSRVPLDQYDLVAREKRRGAASGRKIRSKSIQCWEETLRSSESWREGQKDGPGPEHEKGHTFGQEINCILEATGSQTLVSISVT